VEAAEVLSLTKEATKPSSKSEHGGNRDSWLIENISQNFIYLVCPLSYDLADEGARPLVTSSTA